MAVGAIAAPFGYCRHGCGEPAVYADPEFADEVICEDHFPKNIAFAPFLGQQTKFFQRGERIVFFGGAGGGGKSLCGMMKFVRQLFAERERLLRGEIEQSKAWAVYFRRTTPDLKQAIEKSRLLMEAIDPQAKFNENDLIWTFPSFGNAHFQFSHMEHERDKYKHKSREYTYIFFDELTEFTETQFDYLDTRLRTDDPVLNEMLQICAASNPDGEGLIWVRKRFIEATPEPETVLRIETELSDGRVMNFDQVFIPAKLSDNPRLYKQGTYEASLLNKRPEVREAILSGNWYLSPGAFLANVWNFLYHVVDDHSVPKGAAIFRSCDFGIRSPSEVGWWYVDRDGCMTAFFWLRVTDHDAYMLADRIHEIEDELGLWDDTTNESSLNNVRCPIDEDCFNREATGRTIAAAMRTRGVRWARCKKGPGSRKNGAAEIVMRLGTIVKAADPDNQHHPVHGERPMLRFMRRCLSPIEHLPVLSAAENNPDDVNTKGDDHAWDACFAGDTQIITRQGPRSLADLVGLQPEVLGGDGEWRRATRVMLTRKMADTITVTFETGDKVVCTPDHLFLLEDGSWMEARALLGQRVACWQLAPRSSGSAVRTTGCAGNTFSDTGSGCTVPSGSTSMEPSRPITTSTTSTRTAETTRSRTSPASKAQSTSRRTPGSSEGAGFFAPTSKKAGKRRRRGTPAKRDGNGTGSTQSKLPTRHLDRRSAMNAAPHMSPDVHEAASALRGVTTVMALVLSGPADVYCATVPGPDSFCLANGAVVHNCMYACFERPMQPKADDERDEDEDENDNDLARERARKTRGRGRIGYGATW